MGDLSPESTNGDLIASARDTASDHLRVSLNNLRTDELDLNGIACKNKAAPGEILTLSAELANTGCTFEKFSEKPQSGLGLGVPSLFEAVADQSIIVNSLGIASSGSGVIAC
jgi:hypothetical protein